MKKCGILLACALVFSACSDSDKSSQNGLDIEKEIEKKSQKMVEKNEPKIQINLDKNLSASASESTPKPAPGSVASSEPVPEANLSQNAKPKVEIELVPKPEGKISKDINETIDEFAATAKILGENLERLSKEAPKIIDEFAKKNADKFEDLAKKGEKIVRDLNGSLGGIEKDLMDLAKDANSSFGQILNIFGDMINNGKKIEKHYENSQSEDLKI
ncbi:MULTISPECIES: hypothetical protein [unclassified Campylobacter]|uniref:hypothetical protein n=1 Tax=unclassified Campylobacter TaxID=2593542 RepID=UPI0022E9D0A1|nr:MULTISPECIES: hypothetical protein [unclassified Campylobacter]MDA3042745.1 hypothetical protein [Campylobacter sp. JMF_09 ED2]MDA3044419.1 hypothetical protein [Campylobacter sp. JMF_07 ED4]MDA3063766.1 hypothetical protein [Campylobacter sp. JMF_11 EL3]MDA3071395.1 hypothetical protein [Campylobacter sp. VBCF_03 NA9]MDA3074855.1 hypothetical protein [Campylobacter sp. JMF_05 ED3]